MDCFKRYITGGLVHWLLFLVFTLLEGQVISYPNLSQPEEKSNYVQQLDKAYVEPLELEQTIDEVQKILANDPALPRLTRGEIQELYEKVTRKEYEKNLKASDITRADSMRALMLVLPFNTDNNTEENLQELYMRPPVTKVIEAYTPPEPIKFLTPDPYSVPHTDLISSSNVDATTYKPSYPLKSQVLATHATTYHPPIIHQMALSFPQSNMGFQPVTKLPFSYDNAGAVVTQQTTKLPVQRFSSHYSAKNTDFLRKPKPRTSTTISTIKPVADILESLGIVGQIQTRHRYVAINDYYPAESAPKPVITSYVPHTANVADLHGLQAAKIKTDAYTNFKPLNIGEELRVKPEVEGYLTRFGIVKKNSKSLKKSKNGTAIAKDEPASEESEISKAKVPSGQRNSNTELDKLLENLKELERLQTKTSTKAPPFRTTLITSTSTTISTTPTPLGAAASTASLITNGAPLLIEPKKPRRRIDPNTDINFGTTGNEQNGATNAEQLAKLLENLQELEKLKINPENVLKTAGINPGGTFPITAAVSTTAAPLTQILVNRFSENQLKASQSTATKASTGTQQLQLILKQLHQLEQSNSAFRKTTTTLKPSIFSSGLGLPLGGNDLAHLQRLLSNDQELEHLYEQAHQTKKTTSGTTTISTSTTRKPSINIEVLQAYLGQLDQASSITTTTTTKSTPISTSTTSTTTTTSSTTTTKKTTTAKPFIITPKLTTVNDLAQRIGPQYSTKTKPVDHAQFEELINRVQQLERLNSPVISTALPSTAYLPFSTQNVNALPPTIVGNPSAKDFHVPANNFAQLQQLYQHLPTQGIENSVGTEISAPTIGKLSKPTKVQSEAEDLETRIFELTNDTGSGSSLQDVGPHDYVQLKKLLSKVKELERVKITPSELLATGNHVPTYTPQLVTSTSLHTQNVKSVAGAQIVYPELPTKTPIKAGELSNDGFKIELPPYNSREKGVSPKRALVPELTSSEELRELIVSKPANPNYSRIDKEFEQYQKFFSSLEDNERTQGAKINGNYENVQPPIIEKTIVTKQSPKFMATKKPPESNIAKAKRADLEELQKLLYSTQELKKLGIALPNELSQQLETKLAQTNANIMYTSTAIPPSISNNIAVVTIDATTKKFENINKTIINGPESSSSPAFFSLTTLKPLLPREPKPTTDSNVELPVFSATKIIEAAIKRAANKIGVSTEQSLGFQRRKDDKGNDLKSDNNSDDLMTEFSEINYQLALPPANKKLHIITPEPTTVRTSINMSVSLNELQRLISNLQELKKLNISLSQQSQDSNYLATLKHHGIGTTETRKDRRQSPEANATAQAPTRVSFGNLGLNDEDIASGVTVQATTKITSTSLTTTETATEESHNGSIADLEESFGPNPITQDPPPAKKKNGFYFLADWNSFLEVGEGDDQVVVRLSPKIGDPSLFLPVKIP